MFDKNVMFTGFLGILASAVSVPPEWLNLGIGAVITALVSYIASKITEGQRTRRDIELDLQAVKTQMEAIEDRFDRLEDQLNNMWIHRKE